MDKEECLNETLKHISMVRKFIGIFIASIRDRANVHDKSKTEYPELDIFVEYTPKLKETTYGSEEYSKFLKEMKPALDHHYLVNSHHPEYFKNGIKDMTLIDMVEMLCDWKAATLRHKDGDILSSIEQNQKRFGYSDELKHIFINTIKELEYQGE